MARDPSDPDDDALRWEGDEEPAPPHAGAGVGGTDRVPDPPHADAASASADAPEQPGSAALIGLGVLGGIYLLYTIGWLIGGFRLQGKAQSLISDAMFQGSFWLAVLAPAIWFAAVLLLTRGRAPWLRIVWLVAGGVLLVPWPFVMTGAVGA